MSKTCNFCGNINFKEKTIQYFYNYNGHILIVNDVPCEECDFCGEQYFEAGVLKKIEKKYFNIYVANKKPKQHIRLPLVDF